MNRTSSRVPRYPSMVHLLTRGTFYDVGYNVGLNFSDRIKKFFQESDNIQDKLLPFYDSQAGRDYYEESVKVCQDCFPQYVREVRGIADGAGLPFEHIFMTNVSKEVYNILLGKNREGSGQEGAPCSEELNKSGKQRPQSIPFQENDGCSEVFINRPGCQYIVHNEDCDPAIKPYGYLLSAEIEEDGVKEQFTSYTYPGFLPGCAFSFNVHGLTISVDGLYVGDITEKSPSRLFVNRSVLAARDVDDALRLAKNEPYGTAFGFCLNLSTKEGRMTSVEVGPAKPRALTHVHEVPQQTDPHAPCHYYPFNACKRLEVPQIDALFSSMRRAQRVSELPPPRTLQDALDVMADAHDPLGPIFRTPRPTDRGETACTAVFDVTARQMSLYQGREDLLSDTPFVKLPMYQ